MNDTIYCPNCGLGFTLMSDYLDHIRCYVRRDNVPVWNIEGTPLGERFKQHLKKSEGKSSSLKEIECRQATPSDRTIECRSRSRKALRLKEEMEFHT